MSNDREYHRLAYKIFADFSGTIAIPPVIAALLGTWLDDRFGTGPRLLIILVILAFLATAIIVVKKAKKYGKLYEKLNEKHKDRSSSNVDHLNDQQ